MDARTKAKLSNIKKRIDGKKIDLAKYEDKIKSNKKGIKSLELLGKKCCMEIEKLKKKYGNFPKLLKFDGWYIRRHKLKRTKERNDVIAKREVYYALACRLKNELEGFERQKQILADSTLKACQEVSAIKKDIKALETQYTKMSKTPKKKIKRQIV